MTEGEALVALAEADLAIARAEKELDELPEKHAIIALRHRLEEIEQVLQKACAYCAKADQLVGDATDETATLTAKIEAEQAKVLSGQITNPKEVQNITREIDALLRKKSALENETLALMEKAETGAAQLAKVEHTLEAGRTKEAQLIARYKTKGSALQTQIGRLKLERATIAAQVSAARLARYDSLRATKHGIAVGELEGDMCTACRMALPAERAQAVQAGPEIAECPNCHRLLVVIRRPRA